MNKTEYAALNLPGHRLTYKSVKPAYASAFRKDWFEDAIATANKQADPAACLLYMYGA